MGNMLVLVKNLDFFGLDLVLIKAAIAYVLVTVGKVTVSLHLLDIFPLAGGAGLLVDDISLGATNGIPDNVGSCGSTSAFTLVDSSMFESAWQGGLDLVDPAGSHHDGIRPVDVEHAVVESTT